MGEPRQGNFPYNRLLNLAVFAWISEVAHMYPAY